jgi:site-specific DNA recombinase
MVRAGIYCRISSDRDELRLGVDRQLEDCQKLCAQRGFVVSPTATYIDNNISAADPRKTRPEYNRLVADIQSGKLDAVVVWDADRLHRRPQELESFLNACDEAGLKTLASVGGETDLNDPNALFVLRIMTNLAAMEVEKTRRRRRREEEQRSVTGKGHGGPRPFGFEKGGMIARESEAVLIRQACERILLGATVTGIVRDWNEQGVKTPLGSIWQTTSLKQMLVKPRLAGLRQYKGAKNIVGTAGWPAVLDPEKWRKMVAILSNPARRPPRLVPGAERAYPLRGLLFCSECDSKLQAANRTGHGRTYWCRKAVGADRPANHVSILADSAESWLRENLVPYADSPAMRQRLAQATGAEFELIQKLVSENTEDEETLGVWGNLLTSRETTSTEYAKQTAVIRRRVAERQAQLDALEGQSALDRIKGSVVEQWETLTDEQQRSVFLALVEKIVVSKGRTTARRMHPIWRSVTTASGIKITLRPDLPADLPTVVQPFVSVKS